MQTRLEQILNNGVIIAGLAVIAVTSIELLSPSISITQPFILIFHLMVCGWFLLDFFVRCHLHGIRFFYSHILVFLISLPYLNIFYWVIPEFSPSLWVALRIFPITRGIYSMSLLINRMIRNSATSYLVVYLMTIVVIVYFCSILFYFLEHGNNPMVHNYWDAVNWSLMNVTTVGSNIFGVTKLGSFLASLLAAGGMVFFPIFTAFVTSKVQRLRTMDNS